MNGTLNVTLAPDFVPEVGDRFDIINFNNSTSSFTATNLSNGKQLQLQTSTDKLELVVVAA